MGMIARFRASDGVSVAYHRMRPVDPEATALPPVVLLHGFASESRESWIDPGTTAALLEAGREVIAVDARGHGASDKPHDAESYGETRMGRDVVELVDHLGLGAIDLVGYSMGGVVALLVAAGEGRVRRLVLGGLGAYQVDYDGGPLPHFDAAGFAAALSIRDPSDLTDASLRDFRREIDASGNDRHALAAHLRSFHVDAFAFERVTAPTLVIAGIEDTLSPDPGRLAEALPDATSVTIPGDHPGAKLTRAFIDEVTRHVSHE